MRERTLSAIIFVFFILTSGVYAQTILSSNTEQTCQGSTCVLSLYSYTKYYQESGVWTFLSETIDTINCEQGYNFCVDRNLYQAHFSSSQIKVV